jgi:hypothetical protein
MGDFRKAKVLHFGCPLRFSINAPGAHSIDSNWGRISGGAIKPNTEKSPIARDIRNAVLLDPSSLTNTIGISLPRPSSQQLFSSRTRHKHFIASKRRCEPYSSAHRPIRIQV